MSANRKARICYEMMTQALDTLQRYQKIVNHQLFDVVKTNLDTLNNILENGGIEENDEMDDMMLTLLRDNITIFFDVIDRCQSKKQEMTKEQIIELLKNNFDENNPDNVRDMNINQWLQDNNIVLKKDQENQ